MWTPRARPLLALVLAACGTSPAAPTSTSVAPVMMASIVAIAPPPVSAPAAPIIPPDPRPPALAGDEIVSLEVEGFGPAAVGVPIGSRDPTPIVIATHGNFDKPEWQCEVWLTVFRKRAFVLCPRGVKAQGATPDDQRYTYRDHLSLEREIDADLAALRASAFAPYLSDAPPAYAGFSLGSILGVSIAARRGAEFPTMIWVEGGLDRLTENIMRGFVNAGGARIMFVCAQGGCAGPATLLANRMNAIGGAATVVDAGRVGHTYDGAVAEAVAAALPAFLGQDPAWARVFEPPTP